MRPTRIAGRGVVGGRAEGDAVVSRVPLCFRTEYDPATGSVIGLRHPLYGHNLRGKVLIIPSTKGSCGNSVSFSTGCKEGNAPAALVCVRREPLAVLSCVVNGVPLVCDVSEEIFAQVATGDRVLVDADRGVVRITQRVAAPRKTQRNGEGFVVAQVAQKGPDVLRQAQDPGHRRGARRRAGYPSARMGAGARRT
jgi:predicted aconitase with swiveling domain